MNEETKEMTLAVHSDNEPINQEKVKTHIKASMQFAEELKHDLESFRYVKHPIAFKPWHDPYHIDEAIFGGIGVYSAGKCSEIYALTNLYTVKLGDEVFYTCVPNNRSPFSKYFGLSCKVTFKNGRKFWPKYVLDRSAVFDVIDKHKYIVTRENLEKYQRDFLGINDDERKTYNPLPIQKRREDVLSEIIGQQGLEMLASLGRLKVWQELSKLDNQLFPHRENSTDSTVKKFFDIQKLISFTRGR